MFWREFHEVVYMKTCIFKSVNIFSNEDQKILEYCNRNFFTKSNVFVKSVKNPVTLVL